MWVLFGVITGIALSATAAVWLNKSTEQKALSELDESNSHNTLESLALPLEQKLRNAIYDCERNAKKCTDEINEIYQNLLDLLEGVGKVSYIEVKDKPLYAACINPITGQKCFYYQKDINPSLEEELLERTEGITKKYQAEIEMLYSQRDLFLQLINSHQENIDRINGVKNQEGQWGKVVEHEQKLENINQDSKIEEKAIYNELLLNEINEELEYQEECLKQYALLNNKYQKAIEDDLVEKYKIELKEIIGQLENKDPLH